MSKEKQIEELIEIVKPFVSGLACGDESGSCELTDCRSCRAINLTKAIIEKDYRKQSEWISVEERLPELYTDVITYDKVCGIQIDSVLSTGEFVNGYYVTHWMPLPEAPKGGVG